MTTFASKHRYQLPRRLSPPAMLKLDLHGHQVERVLRAVHSQTGHFVSIETILMAKKFVKLLQRVRVTSGYVFDHFFRIFADRRPSF